MGPLSKRSRRDHLRVGSLISDPSLYLYSPHRVEAYSEVRSIDLGDDLDRCPGANTNAKSATADAVGTEGTADEAMEVWNIK